MSPRWKMSKNWYFDIPKMSGFSTFRTRLKNRPEAQYIMPMQINEIQNDPGTLRWCHIWWFSHCQFFENFKNRKNWHTKNVRIFGIFKLARKSKHRHSLFHPDSSSIHSVAGGRSLMPCLMMYPRSLCPKMPKKKRKIWLLKMSEMSFVFQFVFFYRTRILHAYY